MSFDYQPVLKSDLPLIYGWLARPHIAEWIHGDGLQNTLNGLKNFVEGQPTAGAYWVAHLNETPFAFLISSKRDINEPELAAISLAGNCTVGLDIFIGDVNMTGKGFGALLIKDFLLTNFPNATDFVIDPEATNSRAIRAYEKVGFQIVGEFVAPWHPVKHYLMHVARKEMEMGNGAGPRLVANFRSRLN